LDFGLIVLRETKATQVRGGDGKENEETVSFGSMDRNKDSSLSLAEFQSRDGSVGRSYTFREFV
jgi:hypothetical protein